MTEPWTIYHELQKLFCYTVVALALRKFILLVISISQNILTMSLCHEC